MCCCRTKYPIVLAHGVGSRDDRKFLKYWGRIPKALEENGAVIFYGNQDAWGTIEANAEILKKSVLNALDKTGSGKVNIIAHSKGGLDARYAISVLGMDKYTASLTTISTPHHGSKTIDFICKIPKFLMKSATFFVNSYFRILGDKRPDFFNSYPQFGTEFINCFNKVALDSDRVFYQSYASVMKNAFSDIFLSIPYMVIKYFDGDNDGIVSAASAKWGEFKGVIRGKGQRGVSHADMVDMRKISFKNFDVREVYTDIVKDLKNRGF